VLAAVASLKTALVGLGGVLLASIAGRYADAWLNAQNRLRPFIGDLERTRAVQEELFAVAQRTRNEYDATAVLFQRLAINRGSLGRTNRELLDFTEAVQQAITLSGSTGPEATGALRQFSQLLSSEVVRGAGQELNSIQEQAPRLFKALLDGLDLSQREFRELASQGQLTASQLVGAIERAAPELRREFDSITPTIGSAFVTLNNSITRAIGLFSRATGAGEAFANRILGISRAVDDLASVLAVADKQSRGLRRISFGAPSSLVDGTTIQTQSEEISGTFARVLGRVLLDELRSNIIPGAISVLANLPIVLMGQTVRALQGVLPVFFDIAGQLGTAVADAILDAIRDRGGMLAQAMIGSASTRAGGGSAVDALVAAFTSAEQQALANLRDGRAQFAAGVGGIRSALSILADQAKATGADLDALTGKLTSTGSAANAAALGELAGSFRGRLRQLNPNPSAEIIGQLQAAGFGGDNFGVESLRKMRAEAEQLQALGLSVPDALGLNPEGVALLREYESLADQIADRQRWESMGQAISGTLVDGFSAAVSGARELDDVLRSIGQSLLQIALRTAVGVPLQQGLGSFLAGFGGGPVPSAKGNAFGSRGVIPFAKGGVVDSTIGFGLPDGRMGIAGEAGPEAILPLKRDRQGRLGVRTTDGGGGGGAVQQINHFHLSNIRDTESFRRSERQIGRTLMRAGEKARR